MVDLSADIAGLKLANPTLTCSGTCGYGREYADFMDLGRVGAFVTKSITLEERKGNEPARVVEVRGGMLNAIGLANVGLERFLAEKVGEIRGMPCPVIVNVAGHSVEDYVQVCGAMDSIECVAGVELNVSCPNVKDGLTFGTHAGKLRELVREVKGAMPSTRKAPAPALPRSGGGRGNNRCAEAHPTGGAAGKVLIVKLSPNVEDITATARGAIEGGAQALSMINTFTAMAVDVYKRRPRLANGTGGLSGPAVKPIAVHLVSRVYRGVAREARVPIIGMGGIQSWQDAAEFILAGASAVGIGTALFVDPSTPNKICDGLSAWGEKMGVKKLSELVGALELPGDEPRATPYP